MKIVVLWLGLLLLGGAERALAQTKGNVASDGESKLAAVLGGQRIEVTIRTRAQSIRKYETPPSPYTRTGNCTYSRSPCSEVVNLQIRVGGRPVFVPRSVFADRADIGALKLESRGNWKGGVVLTC